MSAEQWRAVVGREDFYEVSSLGRVRSKSRVQRKVNRWGAETLFRFTGRVLRPWRDGNGYAVVYLCGDGARDAVNVHRLVAAAFHGGERPGMDVNHKDGDKANDAASNLEWCTRSENMQHAIRVGLWNNRKPVIGAVDVGPPRWFASATHAAKALGLSGSPAILSSMSRGHRSAGMHWSYAT